MAGQQRGDRAGRGGEQQGDGAPAAEAPDQGHQHLGQPFVGLPGLAGEGVGKGIGLHGGVGVQHPLAGGDMHPGVAVVEDRR
jgi:hypothetical protein